MYAGDLDFTGRSHLVTSSINSINNKKNRTESEREKDETVYAFNLWLSALINRKIFEVVNTFI